MKSTSPSPAQSASTPDGIVSRRAVPSGTAESRRSFRPWLALVPSPLRHALLILLALVLDSDPLFAESPKGSPDRIAPAISTGTGLLLEPPLDLSKFTREWFEKDSSTVGADRIRKAWTNPVVTLPPHPRPDVHGLTHEEVKDYMMEARQRFERGDSIPVSDVGLISTQEDVVRQPMLNHIAGFSNATVRVYLLVQKTATDTGWSYFSIVQDLTVTPVLDYFAEIQKTGPKFEAQSCYKCHSSGPFAIHPAREDLVLDAPLAAALSRHIAGQPRSRMYFPPDQPPGDAGEDLPLKFCARCHSEDGDRGPLHRLHSHPIRVLVDFGYMPPNRSLKPEEVAELKVWLERKSAPAASPTSSRP